MKRVVSVSLGSSQRDHSYTSDFLGQTVEISRIGFDGNFKLAQAKLRELDGQVAAIGLGGVDISLRCKDQVYFLRDGRRLADCVKTTPVVDGSGLKDTLEADMIRWLVETKQLDFRNKNVLLASALDRYAMAETIVLAGGNCTFADKIFALQLDEPIYSLEELEQEARRLLPELVKMPISFLYPVGKNQNEIEPLPLTNGYFEKADIIAGDFHIIRKRLPNRVDGKIFITNTVTQSDVQELKNRGAIQLITSTPEFNGRSFGTNVLEALCVALLGQTYDSVNPQEYSPLLQQLGIRPRCLVF
jgi:hypothetical protein